MINPALTIRHKLPEAAFRQAHNLAGSLSNAAFRGGSDSFQIDLPLPSNPEEKDEIISFLAFVPSLGDAISTALSRTDHDMTILHLEVILDPATDPANVLPRDVARRLDALLSG